MKHHGVKHAAGPSLRPDSAQDLLGAVGANFPIIPSAPRDGPALPPCPGGEIRVSGNPMCRKLSFREGATPESWFPKTPLGGSADRVAPPLYEGGGV